MWIVWSSRSILMDYLIIVRRVCEQKAMSYTTCCCYCCRCCCCCCRRHRCCCYCSAVLTHIYPGSWHVPPGIDYIVGSRADTLDQRDTNTRSILLLIVVLLSFFSVPRTRRRSSCTTYDGVIIGLFVGGAPARNWLAGWWTLLL